MGGREKERKNRKGDKLNTRIEKKQKKNEGKKELKKE